MTFDWTVLDRMKNYRGDPLMEFQKVGIARLMERKHNLLADEMGLGKTVQAIGLFDLLRLRKILIVCKASIKRNWARKIDEWSVNKRVVQIIDKKTDFISDLAEIVIVNYDIITHSYLFQQLTDIKWDLLICDEAHKLKSMDAKWTHAVLAKNGLAHCAERTLMLTGTPILNRPVEFFPILKVLAPQVIAPYNDYFKYAKRYCDAWQDGFGLNAKGASNTAELNQKLRQHYMIRRLTHEVELQLPKKRYEMVLVDCVAGVGAKLRTLDQATRKDFKHQDFEASGDERHVATMRREVAEQKVETCIDQIKDYVESAGKLTIFAFHHTVINQLSVQLRAFNPVVLDGSCTQIQREVAIAAFQDNPDVKVFIGQIQSAGEGIDGLQDVCHNALFIESDWVPGSIEQAVKRLHRIGQTKPCLFRFLVWADSIEEHMMRVALDKVKVIKEVLK